MNPSMRRRTQLSAIAGTMILALFSGQEALSRGTAGLVIQQTVVQGSAVTVTVANVSSRALTGTVFVRALSTAGEMGSLAPVSVPRGGTTTICVALPAPVAGGLTVGVVLDDGAPF
jgi:hypothetical protein